MVVFLVTKLKLEFPLGHGDCNGKKGEATMGKIYFNWNKVVIMHVPKNKFCLLCADSP